MQLQDAIHGFLRQLAADGRSPHTIGQYRRHCIALANWLATTGAGAEVANLTPDLLARFFASDTAKASCRGGAKKAVSLNAMRTSIRCFCAHLHDAGFVAGNPARMLRRARCAPPPPRALHDGEQKRLLNVLADAEGREAARDQMLVEVLLGCGLRIGSAIGLDIGDVDLVHNELHIRTAKNDRPGVTMLPASVAKKLRAYLAGRTAGPVFRADDRRISIRHAQRRLAGWLKAAGIVGKSAHSMRHAFAMRVYGTTGDLLLTQAALGHAAVSSTVCYAKVDRARLRAAVGA